MYPQTLTIECRNWNIGEHSFQFIKDEAYCRTPEYCEKCTAEIIAENLEKARIETSAKLDDITPPRYLDTDLKHPLFNAKLQEQLDRWEPTEEHPWLGLCGPTGICKTRCAFMVFRRLVLAGIKCDNVNYTSVPTFAAVTAYDFARAVGDQYGQQGSRSIYDDNRSHARRLLDKLNSADFILFDDLGKAKNTVAASVALFAMMDERHAERLVTIWTANGTPESIVAGMADDMADPLARRIRECSTIMKKK